MAIVTPTSRPSRVNKTALFERIGYNPHEKQLLFHNSKARFRVPVCGRRFGKSRMAAAEVTAELMDPTRVTRGWIVGPTYKLGEKEFRYVWEDMKALGILHKLRRKAYNVRTGEMFVEMPWGSKCEVVSAEYPDGLVGEGLDYAVLSEAAKHKSTTWEKQIRPALADHRGWAVFPSTPEGYNWYYQLYMRGIRKEIEYEAWNFPAWENPYVYPLGFEDPEIQDQLRTPEDAWFWQEIGASFRSFVGKIYTEWNDMIHVRKHEYNPEWPNYLFLDFGFASPFVALDAQTSPSDEVFVWREWYKTGMPTYRHANELKQRAQPQGYALRCGFGDSADPGAVETLSNLLVPVYADPDAKDWSRGVQLVTDMLAPYSSREDGPIDSSHLYVDPSCVETVFEFQNYRLRMPTRADENPREDPKKWADHSMDAIRYGLMHLYVIGAKHHLDEVQEDVHYPMPKHLIPPPVEVDPPDRDELSGDHGFFTTTERSAFTMAESSKVF